MRRVSSAEPAKRKGSDRDSHGVGAVEHRQGRSQDTVPRPSAIEKAWYTLFTHARNFPNIPGIPYHV